MSWPCRYFPSREAIVEQFGFVPLGAIWPASEHFQNPPQTSPNYERDWRGKRPALCVQLPSGGFAVDGPYWNSNGYYGDGWKVTGEAPLITLAPSINVVGHYHGWLQNGVISDDCEGRTFPNARGFPS